MAGKAQRRRSGWWIVKACKTLAILPGGHDHDHAQWLIGPVGHHRDSDLVEESNWQTMLASYREIDPEELDHEVHRFGHFAVGWVEEIAYRPGSAVAVEADRLRERLEGYPILDEDHHSMLESEAVDQCWSDWQAREVRQQVTRVLQGRCTLACLASDDEECTCEREARADAIEEQVDAVSDDRLWEVTHELGETYDGSLHLSARDIEAIADAIEKGLPQ